MGEINAFEEFGGKIVRPIKSLICCRRRDLMLPICFAKKFSLPCSLLKYNRITKIMALITENLIKISTIT